MAALRQRPLLLLDVDGVLVLRMVASPGADLGPLLARLAEVFELVWNSRMGDGANQSLGPSLGLPPLPFVDLSGPDCSFSKLPGVQRVAGDRALAWIDDDLDASAHVWAARRPFPTLLIEADPAIGMDEAHVEQLLAFAASLED